MSSTTNDFDFQKFSSILDKSRKQSRKKEYQCCIPGCNEVALHHSHLVSQSALKKYICDDKRQLIQNQIDEINPMAAVKTGEISLEKFYTIGISEAMSMPVFCKNTIMIYSANLKVMQIVLIRIILDFKFFKH